ncbi:helix-turn-helix domain-containing protein [Pedobacter psychrodurus]
MKDGSSVQEIADSLGISRATFYRYLKAYDKLSERKK